VTDKCEFHDNCIASIQDGINSLGDKMDAVLLKSHEMEKEQVRFEEHMKNMFIHISKWWAIPAGAVIALAAIAGLVK